MGRFYTGDIEGKFWVAVQSSTDARHFGGQEYEPNYIEYRFTTEDLPTIEQGLELCNKALDGYEQKMDDFFKDCYAYNDEQLAEYLDTEVSIVKKLLKYYARKELGQKIYNCVKENEECNFEAEL